MMVSTWKKRLLTVPILRLVVVIPIKSNIFVFAVPTLRIFTGRGGSGASVPVARVFGFICGVLFIWREIGSEDRIKVVAYLLLSSFQVFNAHVSIGTV